MNRITKTIFIIILIVTPLAFGSVELWAYTFMELGILGIVILWAIQRLKSSSIHTLPFHQAIESKPILILLSLFNLFILLQMIPLSAGFLQILSPKTYELRTMLTIGLPPSKFPVSFNPFLTRIEFLKWFTFSLLFLFLLYGEFLNSQTLRHIILTIFLLGIAQTLYGMFEFFSGHRHILYLKGADAVTGTFINRNAFAGYLLMVIPLSVGYFISRESMKERIDYGWRARLSNLDGKALLLGFGIILMILGLFFSSSRMGIVSLLLSFTLIVFLFRNPSGKKRFARLSILLLLLALLWAGWIGLDAVISRFFTTTEDVQFRFKIWQDTISILKNFPLFGSGLGTFVSIYPMYRSIHIRGLVTHAENDLLQLASEAGLIGFSLIGILFFYLLIKAILRLRSLDYHNPERYLGIGSFIGILAIIFHSVVEKNLQIPSNGFLFVFLWALILRSGVTHKKEFEGRMK